MRTKLTLCMIAKDEEFFLADCLNSVKDLVDEIIFVDTGSSDRTVEIAKSFGAKVYFQEWEDNFSKPRNLSLSKATGDWILVLDPDERIALKDHEKIKSLISTKKAVVYSMPTRNYSFVKKPFLKYSDSNDKYADMSEDMNFYFISMKTRIFPNNKNIKFRGRVHEIVEKSIREQEIPIEQVNISIHHYAQLDKKRSRYKRFFYMNITRKKVLHNPENAKAYLELGREYFNLRLYYRAAQVFRKGIKLAKDNWLLHELHVQIGNVYEKMNKIEEANKHFEESKKYKIIKKNDDSNIPILLYHDIGDSDSEWCMPLEEFKRQIVLLKKHNYEFVTLSELSNKKKCVGITFDDGRKSVFTKVYPFLKKHDIKATVFITTDWINEKNILESEKYSEFMSWKQVKELSDYEFEIGSHSKSHRDFLHISESDMNGELTMSKKVLEEKIGKKVIHFAYPYGHFKSEFNNLVFNAGYKTISTTNSGLNSTSQKVFNRFMILRNGKNNFFDLLIK